MKYILLLTSILLTQTAQAQWHKATEVLKPPVSKSGYYPSIGYIERYDTVECTLVFRDSASQPGYKMVYIKKGFYIDDKQTLGVFFDTAFHRIYNVRKYKFN